MKDEKPRVLLFTGSGKGKTTAAVGMAIRASGHGMKVSIVQFIKSDSKTGEVAAVRHLPGVELIQTGLGFVLPGDGPAFFQHCEAAHRGLQLAEEVIRSGLIDLVILDEICNAVALKLLSEEGVIEVLRQAGPRQIIVLTGRDAPDSFVALADTVTVMEAHKHALASGRPAQKGVEY